MTGFDLTLFGINEQAYVDASLLEASDGLQNFLLVCRDIETTFGGEFLPLFRNETRVIRSQLLRKCNHGWSHSHF